MIRGLQEMLERPDLTAEDRETLEGLILTGRSITRRETCHRDPMLTQRLMPNVGKMRTRLSGWQKSKRRLKATKPAQLLGDMDFNDPHV